MALFVCFFLKNKYHGNFTMIAIVVNGQYPDKFGSTREILLARIYGKHPQPSLEARYILR